MKKPLFVAFIIVLNLLGSTFLVAQENKYPFKLKTEAKKISATEYDIVIKASIDEGWHMYSLNQTADDGPRATYIEFGKSADYELVGKLTEGKPTEDYDKIFEMKVLFFSHTATFTQRIKLKTDKTLKISGKFESQVCTNEKCIFTNPPEKFSVEIKGAEPVAAIDTVKPKADTAKVSAATETVIPTVTTATPVVNNPGTSEVSKDPWWLILLKGIGFEN